MTEASQRPNLTLHKTLGSEGKALNARQELFVRHYLVDRNATQAAIRAGYSERTAASQGNHLLKNPSLRKKMSINAKKLVQKEFSMKYVGEKLTNEYRKV